MRWEDLSMRERAHLMHLYVKGGVMQLSQMKKHYNAFGGPLRDEYDNPEQYYDYNTAEEAGDMYDEKSKHWASRDPRTGMILKNPKHPTFTLAIREDQSSGYTPFIDSSTGRYFTLRPEEYATAPNKFTLRRVNKFDGNSTETQALELQNPISYFNLEKHLEEPYNKIIPPLLPRKEIHPFRKPKGKSPNIKEFVDILYPIAERVLEDSGYNRDASENIVRQAALESAYGTNPRGAQGYNWGGIKNLNKEANSKYKSTLYRDGFEYLDFDNLYDFVKYKADLLNNRYDALNADTPEEFVERLHGKNVGKHNYSGDKNSYIRNFKGMRTLNKELQKFKK